ncbi:MAG: CHASE2 domain-containing protein [Anaerovoracaceae bacterium]
METKQNRNHFAKSAPLAILAVILAALCLTVVMTPLYTLDAMLCDKLYTKMEGVKRDIRIITIDEETLEEYGSFTTWSREKTADLVELLCADEEASPAVIGLDFLFTGERDTETDERLAAACSRACPIVFASNVVYRGATKQDENGEIYFDTWNVEMVEEPYEALNQVVENGFTNTYVASDGCIRYTKLYETCAGTETAETAAGTADGTGNAAGTTGTTGAAETTGTAAAEAAGSDAGVIDSFAWKLYTIYENFHGREPVMPELNDAGQVNFFYSGQVGEFYHVSLKSVLDGTVPAREFKDCIVLVGAYAPGFQDAYVAAASRSNPMYGVEIQANIVQALMDGKTALPVPSWLYLLIVCPLIAVFFLLARKQKLIPVLLESIVLMGVHLFAGRMLALSGRTVPQLYFIAVILLLMVYFVIEKYFGEKLRRKKMLSTFRKYVASQVVDQLAKDDSFNLKLGGEKRNVAVLFVDIRGFTPLSESLQPEQVVNILNEYLALTTSCILGNNGMLDKFIGDATMAVFNAPFDLDDYVFRAVKAAADMRDGANALAEKLQAQFGKKVSFGIGVNCGEAVVGNIGCEFRMDYTAIGDTVNTAARLESRAAAGEILISKAVYEQLQGRITAEEVGEMELKGKSRAVMVYRVLEIKEEAGEL